jgi:hypothetical protein
MLPSVTFPIVYLIVRGWPEQLPTQGPSVGHGVPPVTYARTGIAVDEPTTTRTTNDNENFCGRLK